MAGLDPAISEIRGSSPRMTPKELLLFKVITL
jgi:hypothetical protein